MSNDERRSATLAEHIESAEYAEGTKRVVWLLEMKIPAVN